MAKRSRRSLSICSLSQRGSLLFIDRGSYPIEEGEKEREVNSSRDLGSVLEVQACQLRYDAFDGSVRRQKPQL